MATRVFEGIKLFQEILKRTMVGTFLWNFIKIRFVVLEKKMFKEKVNARTDGRTTDNGPWHNFTGLWPVELKRTNQMLWPNVKDLCGQTDQAKTIIFILQWSVDVGASHFPKQALVFTCLQYMSFENTVGTSNFSSSRSFFNPSRELSANFIKFEIVICKHFQFGRV